MVTHALFHVFRVSLVKAKPIPQILLTTVEVT